MNSLFNTVYLFPQKSFMTNTAVTPFNEIERIQVLQQYDILDSGPESSFEHIVQLTARLLNAPIALISFVDKDRIWFKSSTGIQVQQMDKHAGLCALAIESDDLFLVEDASADPRTIGNELVNKFGLKFYAAVPLKIQEGYKLGTLCILDKKARTFTEEEKTTLQQLAVLVVDQLESRLAARKAAARQNHILSMVAHELKNPLTLIPVYADLLKEALQNNAELLPLTGHIKRASSRMSSLIHDMLEIGQLQAAGIPLKKTQFEASSFLARVVSGNLVLAHAKDQQIRLESKNFLITADEVKLSEVLDNLINNAIKYSPPGSVISINAYTDSGEAVIKVSDEGPGFTQADMTKLFQPFTRLSAQPTGGENSTGMRLSIVKLLVDAHKGHITAKNNSRTRGATFTLQLPLQEDPVV